MESVDDDAFSSTPALESEEGKASSVLNKGQQGLPGNEGIQSRSNRYYL
jgi:hypothetical protein